MRFSHIAGGDDKDRMDTLVRQANRGPFAFKGDTYWNLKREGELLYHKCYLEHLLSSSSSPQYDMYHLSDERLAVIRGELKEVRKEYERLREINYWDVRNQEGW